ncbi:MAG: acyl carrier protein [Erysipelotrichaceae bacterium]
MFDKIKEVLVDTVNADEELISMEASLKEDLGIDSLAAVELVLELESTFDIRVEDNELMTLKTVKDIVTLVETKQA